MALPCVATGPGSAHTDLERSSVGPTHGGCEGSLGGGFATWPFLRARHGAANVSAKGGWQPAMHQGRRLEGRGPGGAGRPPCLASDFPRPVRTPHTTVAALLLAAMPKCPRCQKEVYFGKGKAGGGGLGFERAAAAAPQAQGRPKGSGGKERRHRGAPGGTCAPFPGDFAWESRRAGRRARGRGGWVGARRRRASCLVLSGEPRLER